MARICPRCNIPMKLQTKKGVEIDRCPKCKGIWFDANELDRLTGEKSLEGLIFTARVLGKVLDCPVCNEKMQFVTVDGITVDHCQKCDGVWLDDGEMAKLDAAADAKSHYYAGTVNYEKQDGKTEDKKKKTNLIGNLKALFTKE